MRRQKPYAAVIPGDSAAEMVLTNGIDNFLNIYNVLLIGRLVLTWFPNPPSAIVGPLSTLCDPYLGLFRGIIPPLGGTLDLSPILAFLVLNALQVVVDIKPNEALQRQFIERNPVTTNVQVGPTYAEHEANTNKVVTKSSSMMHTEGGWPKDIDPTDPEQVIRFRKKVERDETYIHNVATLGAAVEDLVKENNAIDIYQEYFTDDVANHASEQPSARTLTVFRDPSPQGFRRGVSYNSWCPDGSSRKLAIAYSILRFQQQPEGMPTTSYVWDVNNPNIPDAELNSASQCVCIKYNSKDYQTLGAGLYNGQLAVFDPRKGSAPTATSPIERSHKGPIFDFAWLQSKTGTECATVSTDGHAFWWDTRKIGEPVDSLALTEKGQSKVLGAMSMAYEVVAGPTKFMVGTEEGVVVSCNRKAQDKITASYSGHQGPVYSIARNPFFPKYFMSIGDWTARIWYEDLRSPIITSKYHQSYLVGGKWSPVRPGVLFTIKSDGAMDVWDYFYRQNDPTLTVKVGDSSLSAFDIQDSGRLVTVGSEDGSTTLYDLSEGLTVMQQGEKQAVNQMLERETKQERNLEQRMKERKFKVKKEETMETKGEELPDEVSDDVLKQAEQEFFTHVLAEDGITAKNPLDSEDTGSNEEAPGHRESSKQPAGGDEKGGEPELREKATPKGEQKHLEEEETSQKEQSPGDDGEVQQSDAADVSGTEQDQQAEDQTQLVDREEEPEYGKDEEPHHESQAQETTEDGDAGSGNEE